MQFIFWIFFRFLPKRAQIEITNRCNLNCLMCPRKNFDIKEKDMDFNLFKKVIDKLHDFKYIALTGWGEPTLHPYIGEMIRYCKQKRKYIYITTNGLFQEPNLIEQLLQLDAISFSIDRIKNTEDFSHNNISALKNIQKMILLRKEKNIRRPKIIIQSVYYGKNKDDIFEIIKWAKNEGVDMVKVITLNIKYIKEKGLHVVDDSTRYKVYRKLYEFSRHLEIRLDISNFGMFKNPLKFIYKIALNILPKLDIYCFKMLNYIYLTVDGYVTPCCELPQYIVGDLNKEDIKSIWFGKKLKDFKVRQKEICKECSFAIKK